MPVSRDRDHARTGRARPAPAMDRDIGVVEVAVRGLDGQLAAVRHGVAGVEREVEERVLELVASAKVRQSPPASTVSSDDGLAERAAQELAHPRHQLVGVDRPWAPAAAGARRRAAGWSGSRRAARPAAPCPGRARCARPPADAPSTGSCRPIDVEAAEHDGEQVVEVVRDAAGELADGLHLLRLAQRAPRPSCALRSRLPARACAP